MTASDSRAEHQPTSRGLAPSERALVLVGFGLAGPVAAGGLPPLQAVAQRLATLLAVPTQRLSPLSDPNAALTALRAAADGKAADGETADGEVAAIEVLAAAPRGSNGPGGLVALEMDPGLALPVGGSWVEALGAWRQPCVLVIGADQLACGWPAAGTALLQRWGVPLLGLVQWGGAWDRAARRGDGLPWLGIAAGVGRGGDGGDGGAEPEAALAAVLALRWQLLDLG